MTEAGLLADFLPGDIDGLLLDLDGGGGSGVGGGAGRWVLGGEVSEADVVAGRGVDFLLAGARGAPSPFRTAPAGLFVIAGGSAGGGETVAAEKILHRFLRVAVSLVDTPGRAQYEVKKYKGYNYPDHREGVSWSRDGVSG